MQFKHPEILYALFLLVIPIIIHLFQLRRFKKVEFTNVNVLKALSLQTRKSSQIKKWLILFTRLLIFSCLIFAFAQPFFSDKSTIKKGSETVIYLDNSFSMQAQGANGSLLNDAIQDILKHHEQKEQISLFTNTQLYSKTTVDAIKNDLIKLSYSHEQLDLDAAILKAKNLFSESKNSNKNLILVSDFQSHNNAFQFEKDSAYAFKMVQLKPRSANNIAIDSAWVSSKSTDIIELKVKLSSNSSDFVNVPISLFNEDKLVAKSSVKIDDETVTTFSLPNNQDIKGRLVIEDQGLQYDNSLFFNIGKPELINVLAVNANEDNFLKRIYSEDEFNYTGLDIKGLNYNLISEQNLIILNEVEQIPNALKIALRQFHSDGGQLIVIPSENDISINSYNNLFSDYAILKLDSLSTSEKKITSINYNHPLLEGVFEKRITNFQYPKVQKLYHYSGSLGNPILSFEDYSSFLLERNNIFTFTTAINTVNSNFQNSPLIVPIFYNIGKLSLNLPTIYYTIGQSNQIDIKTNLGQDEILELKNKADVIIPLQQTFNSKVELFTEELPETANIYSVFNQDSILTHLSYNYNRKESKLNYLELNNSENYTLNTSLRDVIDDIKIANNVNELWKWFVIFALGFLIIEMLILKFLK
ncbi:MAG: hypothetical protein BM564_07915 [Bacteroidetes bacterium MedPE-SWsnd-G2]|nr:MAG: hypothetical protein BM564_07915 [Bacteroidetes bacterium MedPE-SWsnd-G2]